MRPAPARALALALARRPFAPSCALSALAPFACAAPGPTASAPVGPQAPSSPGSPPDSAATGGTALPYHSCPGRARQGESPGSPGGPPSVPHVEVTAVEYSFTLSRPTVPAGKVILQFVNRGQDEHNLNAAPLEGNPLASVPNTRSGEVRQLSVELRRGSLHAVLLAARTREEGHARHAARRMRAPAPATLVASGTSHIKTLQMAVDGPAQRHMCAVCKPSRRPDMLMHLGRRHIVGRNRKIAGLLAFVARRRDRRGRVRVHGQQHRCRTLRRRRLGDRQRLHGRLADELHVQRSGRTMTAVKFHLNKAATDVEIALTGGAPERPTGPTAAPRKAHRRSRSPAHSRTVPDGEGLKLSVAAVSSGTVTIE